MGEYKKVPMDRTDPFMPRTNGLAVPYLGLQECVTQFYLYTRAHNANFCNSIY